MTETAREVGLAPEIIRAYKQAKDTYINAEEKYRQWARATLEDFKNALKYLVESSSSTASDIKSSRKRQALEYLTHIYDHSIIIGQSSLPIPEEDCQIPNSVSSLHDLAETAYLHYAGVAGKPKISFISRFRDALDHLIDAADHDTPVTECESLVAQTREHLLETAAESYQLGTSLLSRRANRLLWLRRLFWKGLHSALATTQRLRRIRTSIADGRRLKGRLRESVKCCEYYEQAFNEAYVFFQETNSGGLGWWVKIGGGAIPIALSITLFLLSQR